jgi:indolepyruvate decarboxylase
MSQTTVQHVLSRLRQLGIADIFGVPGDFAFPINDAICQDKQLRFIGSCNELNAAYAADGYARIKGVAAVNTTYGVGELSALNAIAGSYAEHLPVFHLVGMPNLSVQHARAIVHHTLGNGEFDLFYQMTAPAVCARTIITPENCVAETERLVAAALYHRRPVYLAFPSDTANQAPIGSMQPLATPRSDTATLESAVSAIVDAVTRAKTACILPGILLVSVGLRAEATALVDACGLPFATMLMDKTTLDETHPNYIGMYNGALTEESVRAFVEGADCVLSIGAIASDLNTGAFTARLDRSKTINILHHRTRVGHAVYENVEMKDVLSGLVKRLPKRTDVKGPKASELGDPQGRGGDKITAEALYPRWGRFLKPNDILVAEDGHELDGDGLRTHAERLDVPQPNALGLDRLGHAGCLRRRAGRSKSSDGFDYGRGFTPAHRAGGGPVSSLRFEADHLLAEQQWLLDRAPALQRPRHLLQRSRTVALSATATSAWL